jgi:hypothetical protein
MLEAVQQALTISEESVEFRVDAGVHRCQRFAIAQRHGVVRFEGPPLRWADRTHWLTLEVAVINLYE